MTRGSRNGRAKLYEGHLLQAAGLGDKSYLFTLHKPSMLPFLSYAKDRKLREELYTAYLDRCNHGDEYDNKALVNDYIRLRTEKAHLLGYDSFADYVTADQMAATPAAVYALLDEIWTPALDRAKEELAAMEEMLRADHPDATFEPWDWWYYAEKVRRRDYALDDEALRPYFTLENVQGGIFFLANRLYGITFRPIVAPLYNPDCLVYEVLDEDESHLGVLYFDYYVREGKSGGAWCGNFTEQYYENGERVAPVVGVVTNYARPTRSTPTLLNLDETKTLFHEFGHALHSLFRKVEYRGLADVEGDFVELPSQIMENWATEKQWLDLWAEHYETGEKMPAELVEKIVAAKNYLAAYANVRQLSFGMTDMAWHTLKEPFTGDVEAFEKQSMAPAQVLPVVDGTAMNPAFTHIFSGGYAAGYYGYKWAEVLEADAFKAFEETGSILGGPAADAFRKHILTQGGHEHPMKLYVAFRGHKPETKALIEKMGIKVLPLKILYEDGEDGTDEVIRRRPDEAEPNPAGFGSVSFFGRGGTNVTVIRSETPSLPAHLRFVAVGRQRAGSGRSAVCCMGRRLSCRHRPSCRRSAGIGVGINCGRAYFFISDRVFRRGGVIFIVRAVAEAAYGMPDPLRSSPFEPTEIRMPME